MSEFTLLFKFQYNNQVEVDCSNILIHKDTHLQNKAASRGQVWQAGQVNRCSKFKLPSANIFVVATHGIKIYNITDGRYHSSVYSIRCLCNVIRCIGYMPYKHTFTEAV